MNEPTEKGKSKAYELINIVTDWERGARLTRGTAENMTAKFTQALRDYAEAATSELETDILTAAPRPFGSVASRHVGRPRRVRAGANMLRSLLAANMAAPSSAPRAQQ